LVTYINAVHPLERVFDGFIPFTWFGSGSSIDDPAVMDPTAAGFRPPPTQPTRVRDDLDVPVLVVNSECETLSCVPIRQPDTERFRYWEVAGAPHGPRLHMERIVPKLVRDGLGAPGGGVFDASVLSPVPWAPVLDAAIAHLDRWVQGGPVPPTQPLIEIEGDPPRIKRDADGNAIGGLRMPEMEAPLARHTAAREEAGDGGLMGKWEPFASDVVHARYRDDAAYLAAYEAASRAAVDAGVLRPHDAAEGVLRAKAIRLA
jgi:hypothetical protein